MSVNEKMTALADAIRSKTGETKLLSLDEMVISIQGIEAGGGGGSSSGGVCPLLQITFDCNRARQYGYLIYSSNGEYKTEIDYSGRKNIEIENVDIGRLIFMEFEDPLGIVDTPTGTNIERIEYSGYFSLFSCTVPGENSTITLKELEV